jgi:hypothetical protein
LVVTGSGTLSLSAVAEGALSASCRLGSDGVHGSLTLRFPSEENAAGRVRLSLTDGVHSADTVLETKTYRFCVEAEPVVLGSVPGSRALLSYRVDTDIPDCRLNVIPEEEAFFTIDGDSLVVLEGNPYHHPRESFLTVSESSGRMSPQRVAVWQQGAPAPPGEGAVVFQDAAFRAAMTALADTDGDGEVSFGEALEVREVDISGKGVRDLTGLEAFSNVWKLDARDNDIVDATVLRELHRLYWLDLRGNGRLRTFDVTGCTLYFEHCAFETPEGLVYYTLRNQVGVTNASDPYCHHSRHLEDTRRTTDWSGQDGLVLMREHTCGDGYPVVFTGVSYLDADMEDGSFERLMRRSMELMLERYPGMDEWGDRLDVYCVRHRAVSRNEYYLPDADCRYDNPVCMETYGRFLTDEAALLKRIYHTFYGEGAPGMGMLAFLVECTPSGHPARFAATLNFTGWYDDEDPFRYGPVVTCCLHRGMDDVDESVYGGLSSQLPEELFLNVPSGEDYDAFLRLIAGE